MFQVLNDVRLTKNFLLSEIASDDNEVIIDMPSILMLQQLRDYLGCPIYICSAYRSEAYNKASGGVSDSLHRKGIAFDIKAYRNGKQIHPKEVAKAAEKIGFKGIGIYTHNDQFFTHIDTRGYKRYWKDSVGIGNLINIKSLDEV